MADNPWAVLGLLITVVIGPVVMWYLNRKQTQTLKTELQAGAQKLDAVQETASKAEVAAVGAEKAANGNLEAKEQRIRELEAKIRAYEAAE